MSEASGRGVIDLRSDTVTRPTPAMRRVMAEAEVGDDVLGDDPWVKRLEEKVAGLLGKEAACFVPSGTMANQLAIRVQAGAGDEIVCHEDSHIIHYETGGPAALSGCMVRPIAGPRGMFEAGQVLGAVRALNQSFPASRLLVVEQTHNRGGGSVWPLELLHGVTEAGRGAGLAVHMDGARVWNACAASGVSPAAYGALFDTVSCCFSKGLGAPVGSALCGTRGVIERAKRFRKMFGGSMRQSGILAAAAAHALDHHRSRLAEDHANARRLATLLSRVPGVTLDPATVETNIVIFGLDERSPVDGAQLCERLKTMGVLALPTAARRVRMVTHLDVSAAMIDAAAGAVGRAVAA